MKLSKDTLAKLKNFAEINSNLLIHAGSALKTVNAGKNLASETSVAEVFKVSDEGFGIYDLNEFLGILSLFEDPELEFSDKYVSVSQGNTNIKFFGAAPAVLVYPHKDITFPETDVEFKLDNATIATIRKVAAVLKATDVSIVGDGSEVTIKVGDARNATASTYSSTVGTTDKQFSVNIKVDYMKLLPGDYVVSISKKKISRFVSGDSTYFIAIESTSTFDF